MFTGVIEATARILAISSKSLIVERPKAFDDVQVGSSVCISGVCLTVVTLHDTEMCFDLTEETITRSTFGRLRTGDRVNLERAMNVGDRLEGHVVQGHVEGVGICRTMDKGQWIMEVEVPSELRRSVATKGSIAIDGVSLTVARVDSHSVTIALIPHTIENTTLGERKPGDAVNVETDMLMRRNQEKEVPRIGIVYADYYKEEIAPLLTSARQALLDAGLGDKQISLHPVAGSFEIPLLGMQLAKSGKLDALIALGIIVEGETHHADLLAREVAHGIMHVQLMTGVPFAFEVLYVRSLAQVRKRHHRGSEAARATLHSLLQLRRSAPSE